MQVSGSFRPRRHPPVGQTNPVRISRFTVGAMTELNDHLKLLFARAAVLHRTNVLLRKEIGDF